LNYTDYYINLVRRFEYTANLSPKSREVLYLKFY